MTPPALYLDEDTQSEALIQALRARGIDVLTTSEANMSNRSDEEQLDFALARNRVLVTCNIGDFARLHSRWSAVGRAHAGLILIQQQKWGPGELTRRLLRLLAGNPGQSMRSRVEFIGHW